MEVYYVDPSASTSTEDGTTTNPYKALQTGLTARCNKTFTDVIQFRCRTSGSVADTTRASTASLNSMVTSASYYLEIVAETGHRAGTSWDTSKYHLYPAYSVQGGTALELDKGYTRVDGLQIGISSQTSTAEIVYWTGANGRLSNCFIRGINSGEYTRGLSIVNGLTVWNCIICNLGTGAGHGIVNHGNSSIYSCTVIGPGGGVGFYAYDGTLVLKNTYFKGSSGYALYFDAGVTAAKTNCASDDSTADDTSTGITQSNCIVNIAYDTTQFTNTTAGSQDLALPGTGSALYGVGTDTSGEGDPLNFTTDINGATRTTTWDIGADEYISAGASGQPLAKRLGGVLHSVGASPLSGRRW